MDTLKKYNIEIFDDVIQNLVNTEVIVDRIYNKKDVLDFLKKFLNKSFKYYQRKFDSNNYINKVEVSVGSSHRIYLKIHIDKTILDEHEEYILQEILNGKLDEISMEMENKTIGEFYVRLAPLGTSPEIKKKTF